MKFGHYFSVRRSLLFGQATPYKNIVKNYQSHYFSVRQSLLFGQANQGNILINKDLQKSGVAGKYITIYKGEGMAGINAICSKICILLAEFFSLLLSFCGNSKNTLFLTSKMTVFGPKIVFLDPFFVNFDSALKNTLKKA